MSDQLSHGVILDVIEQQAELVLEAMDFENFAPGKPFKSGTLTFPETANNRAALGELYDTDGANKVRIIENVTYENEVTTLRGSLVISGQTNDNGINSLNGFFLAGNALLWLDFGDTKLTELDWSAYNHTLNITTQQEGNDLVKYDLTDRGKYIDTDAINMIERYPAFNLAEMLKVIFKDYDLQSNFIAQTWFTKLYLLFTQTNQIRNSDDWTNTALVHTTAYYNFVYIDSDLDVWENFDINGTFNLVDSGDDDFDNGNNFNNTTHVYVCPETGTYRFKIQIGGNMTTDDGAGNLAEMRYNSSGGNPHLIYRCIVNDTVELCELVADDYDFSLAPIIPDENIDTDYIELQQGDEVKFTYQFVGQYRVTSPPATGFEFAITASATMLNQVSRYYGYGSTVNVASLMPDIKVNDFIKMLFQHFSIMPQFSHESNIVRLNVWERQQNGFDLTTSVNSKTGSIEYGEGFDYEMIFTSDGSDQYANKFYMERPTLNGSYKSNNHYNVKKIFQSAFSNTVMHSSFQLLNDRTFIPILWTNEPGGKSYFEYLYNDLPEWRTTFNYRIVQDDGVNVDYPVSHHTADVGREVETLSCNVLTSSGIEFTDMHDQLHEALISRINNGSTLTIQAVLPVGYLNKIINNDTSVNLYTPVYIGVNPYVGMYTIRQIVTNGQITQLTLILNNE